MRTPDDMVNLAKRIRRRMIDEGKDPLSGEFQCTVDELLQLRRASPPYATPDDTRDRICGLKIVSY